MSKVCVAICNYNHELFLEQSIKSITSQDYQDLDIVVVDDYSKNRLIVQEIVENVSDNRVRIIQLDENKGKWNALNIAFSTTNAQLCTSHDADDVSLSWRISQQIQTLKETNTLHNLCGFTHCFTEEDVAAGMTTTCPQQIKMLNAENTFNFVHAGFKTAGVNHYYTGNFETAGVSAMFPKWIWDIGFRFNPPAVGVRVLHSEDSDFNCRVTLALRSTSVLAETPYLYRRNTSTNKELR